MLKKRMKKKKKKKTLFGCPRHRIFTPDAIPFELESLKFNSLSNLNIENHYFSSFCSAIFYGKFLKFKVMLCLVLVKTFKKKKKASLLNFDLCHSNEI
jgi:hypothetical protein